MITVIIHKHFKKAYKDRIFPNNKLDKQAGQRITMFKQNPQHPLIHDHPLKGSRTGERAFSVAGDVRIIYRRLNEDTVLLLDIGSHNQVYR